METSRAAVIQMRVGPDVTDNQHRAEAFVIAAAGSGAKIVALPEMYYCMGSRQEMLDNAIDMPGTITHRWSEIAKDYKIWIVCGSLLERISGNERAYNTTLLINPAGEIAAKFRKLHLFDVDVPGVVTFTESAAIEKGTGVTLADSAVGKIGFGLCYDLRFPEMFRGMAKRGMEILAIPSAFSKGTGKHHWTALLRARAIENQCYVLAPNQVGQAPNKFTSYGHSAIIDPWGEVLAEAGWDEEAIIQADLDGAKLRKIRMELPALEHTRTDLFRM
ncbi:MAG: carbon-nitrogen hydrolase family protein [Planctomycetes bacterium]|nr:carbon-nitrogen hydrolase family protein [Planctomycetota bacterium]